MVRDAEYLARSFGSVEREVNELLDLLYRLGCCRCTDIEALVRQNSRTHRAFEAESHFLYVAGTAVQEVMDRASNTARAMFGRSQPAPRLTVKQCDKYRRAVRRQIQVAKTRASSHWTATVADFADK